MEFKELLKSRRTIRKFKQLPLNMKQLTEYINAARLAPSAANRQPLKYVAVTEHKMTNAVFFTLKWAGYLKGAYDPKESERPTGYIVICTDGKISDSNCDTDVGAAAENIILSALADGVGSCWLASVDRPQLAQILNLDENFAIAAVIALGYPAESPQETELLDGDVKYFVENDVLKVPKRSLEEVIIKKL